MPETEYYRNIVFGSGTGGKVLAWTLAEQGERTAVVERKWIGGSCHNIACMPSKNVVYSARVASLFRRAAEFGIRTQPFSINMEAVRERKRKMVEDSVKYHLAKYKDSGADLILGEGRMTGPRTLEVKTNEGRTRRLTADRLFLNVGTHATIPDTPGLAAARPMTHIEALELDRVSGHLILLGGGYVGLAQARARGIQYRAVKMPGEGVLRARTISETRGFLKMLMDERSNRILGFTAFATEAGEVMAVVQTAMLSGAPFTLLRDSILTHPTMAEGLALLLADVKARDRRRSEGPRRWAS